MKKILIIILLSIGFYFVFAQNDRVFYYHYDKKIFLDKLENTRVIHFNKTIELLRKDSICNILIDRIQKTINE